MKILLDLASSLRSIYIWQEYHHAVINFKTSYFFGLQNSEWGSVIAEMFTRKIEKLQIENYRYQGFLNTMDFNLLKEVIFKVNSQ